MIRNFKYKDTKRLAQGISVRRFRQIETVAHRKLTLLNAAASLTFLKVPPGNHLEALKGDREGQYSIRINAQWRICFRFQSGHVLDVEIVDYH